MIPAQFQSTSLDEAIEVFGLRRVSSCVGVPVTRVFSNKHFNIGYGFSINRVHVINRLSVARHIYNLNNVYVCTNVPSQIAFSSTEQESNILIHRPDICQLL